MQASKSEVTVNVSFEVLTSIYQGSDMDGDFSWMSQQAIHAKTLFIFNDNEEQFEAFVRGDAAGVFAGGGNAAIRPLRGLLPPRAAGVPTGDRNGGYAALDIHAKKSIDQSLALIQELLDKGQYERMIISRDPSEATLGTGIFHVNSDVKKYIFDSLMSMRPR